MKLIKTPLRNKMGGDLLANQMILYIEREISAGLDPEVIVDEFDFRGPSASQRERCITHYSSSQTILLVGEGDFSFSACLAKAFGSANNMVATSLDSEVELEKKHWSAAAHLEELRALGCTIIHNVDVLDMHERRKLKKRRFDRIIFNFPHAGHDPLCFERSNKLIRRHKNLLSWFFVSASKLLSEGGEIHVAHRNDEPYNWWKIKKLAKKAGLEFMEKTEFIKGLYPGYHNKRGGGINSNKTFPLGECFTYKFSLRKDLYTDGESSNGGGSGVGDELAAYLSTLRV